VLLLDVQKGKLLSVYDGKTEYTLSKWTVAKHGAASWVPIYACFYVYQDPLEVRVGRVCATELFKLGLYNCHQLPCCMSSIKCCDLLFMWLQAITAKFPEDSALANAPKVCPDTGSLMCQQTARHMTKLLGMVVRSRYVIGREFCNVPLAALCR
jgi:hypothetical protein